LEAAPGTDVNYRKPPEVLSGLEEVVEAHGLPAVAPRAGGSLEAAGAGGSAGCAAAVVGEAPFVDGVAVAADEAGAAVVAVG